MRCQIFPGWTGFKTATYKDADHEAAPSDQLTAY
jgi:hypothetical protein